MTVIVENPGGQMTKKPETRLVKRIIAALENEVGGYWVKIWGGGDYQRAGLPDIMGSCEGLFFGLEAKLPGGDYEPLQRHEAKEIKAKGKGIAACVHSPEEALKVVRAALRRTKARR